MSINSQHRVGHLRITCRAQQLLSLLTITSKDFSRVMLCFLLQTDCAVHVLVSSFTNDVSDDNHLGTLTCQHKTPLSPLQALPKPPEGPQGPSKILRSRKKKKKFTPSLDDVTRAICQSFCGLKTACKGSVTYKNMQTLSV
ncbi:Hypothetical predicted protein [Xyrichtys novacula]|uniref:Uncharacterized protein n=1 Tax=Xyrichtys novacula TaxID=13765 RepID=A0AAV1H3I9_XYRNO|nr:Hypothetical predicted protein [Xyrichtys novacula]